MLRRLSSVDPLQVGKRYEHDPGRPVKRRLGDPHHCLVDWMQPEHPPRVPGWRIVNCLGELNDVELSYWASDGHRPIVELSHAVSGKLRNGISEPREFVQRRSTP